MALIDEFLPEYEVSERHSTIVAAAPPDALAAARTVTPGELPLVRALFALRSLPALVVRRGGLPAKKDEPLAEQMVDFGFVPLAPGDDEIVLGFAGKRGKVTAGSMRHLPSADAWSKFNEPGYVKAAMNFRTSAADGGALLETETRVRATDSATRRRFARYWRLISPGSAAIRRAWLKGAKRRAERASFTNAARSSPR